MDCGHVPQVERPEECHRLVLDFFARVEAGEAGAVTRLGRGAQAA
jgi:hypothetical protein